MSPQQSRRLAVARPPHVSEGAADARLARRRRERRRAGRTTSGTAAKARRPGRSLRGDVTEPILVWDTTTVPNGTYFVKIVASDAPSNAADTALAGELDSSAFEIDNTRARDRRRRASAIDGGRTIVTFDVTDDHSPIQRVECSQDGQQWRTRVSDRRHRRLALRALRGGARRPLGPRGLTLRVTDAMNNVDHAREPSDCSSRLHEAGTERSTSRSRRT